MISVKDNATDVEGYYDGYRNRPVVGGYLALLALVRVTLCSADIVLSVTVTLLVRRVLGLFSSP